MGKESFGEKIRRLRKDRGWSQALLAIKADLPRTTIVSTENRKSARPSGETVALLAKAFNLSVNDLLGKADSDNAPETPEQILERYRLAAPVSIPVYDHFIVHAGPATEAPSDYIYRPRAQAAPGNIEGYRVHGTCMEPEIPDGSIVIIDRDRAPQVGNIVLCLEEGQVLIGRMIDKDGQLYLKNGHGEHLLSDCEASAVVIEVTKRLV